MRACANAHDSLEALNLTWCALRHGVGAKYASAVAVKVHQP